MPCSTGTLAPNFTVPRSVQWNLDLQRVITNNLTLDVAYVGNHGYNEQYLNDLNEPLLGAGNTPWTSAQLTAAKKSTADAGFTSAQMCLGRRAIPVLQFQHCGEIGPYSTTFPYLNFIMQSQSGVWSNYDALQVTMDQRLSHGLSFLVGYTYGHALDIYSSISQGNVLLSNSNNPSLNYGSSDNDVRHRITISPSYAIPGIKSPGQMLEGWSISGILLLQSGAHWYANDNNKTDWLGTGEFAEAFSTQVGQYQYWNYSGPRSAFKEGLNLIPCYAGASSTIKGCANTLASNAAISALCSNAAAAPYGGPTTTNGMLALAALANGVCYIQNGGILTPPAYGTLGNAGRNIFGTQPYYNLDFSIAKIWHYKERYTAQFRLETFNLLDRVDWAAPSSSNPTSPSTFGLAASTADNGNAVLGSGGPRHIQFALKLTF